MSKELLFVLQLLNHSILTVQFSLLFSALPGLAVGATPVCTAGVVQRELITTQLLPGLEAWH